MALNVPGLLHPRAHRKDPPTPQRRRGQESGAHGPSSGCRRGFPSRAVPVAPGPAPSPSVSPETSRDPLTAEGR